MIHIYTWYIYALTCMHITLHYDCTSYNCIAWYQVVLPALLSTFSSLQLDSPLTGSCTLTIPIRQRLKERLSVPNGVPMAIIMHATGRLLPLVFTVLSIYAHVSFGIYSSCCAHACNAIMTARTKMINERFIRELKFSVNEKFMWELKFSVLSDCRRHLHTHDAIMFWNLYRELPTLGRELWRGVSGQSRAYWHWGGSEVFCQQVAHREGWRWKSLVVLLPKQT